MYYFSIPVVVFEDFVEDSDWRDDLVADEYVASPIEWGEEGALNDQEDLSEGACQDHQDEDHFGYADLTLCLYVEAFLVHQALGVLTLVHGDRALRQ